MKNLSDVQIKNILDSLNLYKENTKVEYDAEDIKYGYPDKTMPCYIIMHNSRNEEVPHIFMVDIKTESFINVLYQEVMYPRPKYICPYWDILNIKKK